ncbi:MAG: hypothetical protein ACT4PX_09945 [Actinomycetota bacterium]
MTAGTDRSSSGGRLALVAWMAALAAAVGLLHALGGALAPPPLTDPGGWGRWLEARQPAEAAFAVVRLVALGLAWYLLAVTATATLARLSGAPALVRAADVVTVPLVRRLVNGAVGASLVAVTLAGSGTAGAAARADPPAAAETMRRLADATGAGDEAAPVMQRLPDAPAGAGRDEVAPSTHPDLHGGGAPGEAAPPPLMRRLPDVAGAGGTAAGTASPAGASPSDPPHGAAARPPQRRPPADDPAATSPRGVPAGRAGAGIDPTPVAPPGPTAGPAGAVPVPTDPRAPTAGRAGATPTTPPGPTGPTPTTPPGPTAGRAGAGARTWTVRPGDHFWGVAEQVLAEALRCPASDQEVDPYWRAVVEANRSVLRDPANPDLLFPGQVIAIPPPPAG